MLSRFESHLGLRLFERGGKGAILTAEGEVLYRRVADGFRSVEAGLREVEQLRAGKEIVTISVSSAFSTHWLMPRMDRFQKRFPGGDLRFLDSGEGVPSKAMAVREVMLPICSPGYRRSEAEGGAAGEGNTIINLTDSDLDWAGRYPPFVTGRPGPIQTLSFSDYAVVVQAALLGQGVAFGGITVVSHALMSGALVPASDRLTWGERNCVLLTPRNRQPRPVVGAIRDWIEAELKAEIEAIDGLHPGLSLRQACYQGQG